MCCVWRTKIKNLKAIHNVEWFERFQRSLCSKNKDKKSESNSQRLQFNMSGCIPYRRRPPPVRNMRAVLKKASYGTRRVFRSPPCSKQASGVPTEAEERGSCSEIGDFAKNGHLYAPVTAAKQSQSAVGCHQTTANHCKPLQIATDCHGQPQTAAKLPQSAMDYFRLPPTPLNYRRLPRPTARLPQSRPDRYQAPANYAGAYQ